jgi:glycine cleavage system H protein
MYPNDRKYSKEHEWALLEPDGRVLVGITEFAQEELGDVVYVALPKVGTQLAQFAMMGEIESVKTVSDLFTPVSGEVVELNGLLTDQPELVNEDVYGQGWLIRMAITDKAELDNLLTADEYQAIIAH